ncbi:PAS domain-containing protein [Chitinophaga oryzae]|uniref:histidine kinase n=1 Tax=Chitinophaga oryzae TaxID=2725414 RepID=A0AAE6ZMS6_9BACT|nr:PAS domain-containing protein [Chitinophaga oryzae]QJB34813.1 PAS domain-containing protein [Chitinophaga oryzae]QJB41328.1 PAS domain-containing protein [Chitinophaga oryzae]
MQRSPIKMAGLCLLFVIIVINGYLLTGSESSTQKTWLILNEIVLCSAFVLLTATLIRKQPVSQFENLYINHPIPMWIYEKDTLRFLFVNEAACKKYGYTRHEFLALTIKDIRENEELDALMDNVRERCNGTEYRGIWKHRRKSGENFFVEIYAHSAFYEGKEARFIMAKDVDEQVRAAKEAHQLGVRYELLAQATNDALYDRNLITNEVLWKHGLESMFQHPTQPDTDLFVWWKSNIHPADGPVVMSSLDTCLQNRTSSWSQQYRFRSADGTFKYVVDRAFIIYENDQPTRMIGIVQDIDQYVKQAVRLEKQNKTLREIAWINSHEIRRPVVSILSITNLFDKSNQDVHLNSRLMEWLHQSTRQLDEIIHKIEHKVKNIE